MPILIKDNIDTGDRMLTSVGSLAFTEAAPRDAELVARVRMAGAVILGKTNPSEWVKLPLKPWNQCWSARGGQTHNPYVLPVGIILFGAKWSEPTLISIAYGSEQHAHAWQPPQFLETVGGKIRNCHSDWNASRYEPLPRIPYRQINT
jgi:amidase